MVALVALFYAQLPVARAAERGLSEAREQLRATRDRMHQESEKLTHIQRVLDRLATEMAKEEEALHEIAEALDRLDRSIEKLDARMLRLQEQLNERNREAFVQGP